MGHPVVWGWVGRTGNGKSNDKSGGPSTPLRSGRDDVRCFWVRSLLGRGQWKRRLGGVRVCFPPFAKARRMGTRSAGAGWENRQRQEQRQKRGSLPLRCAPVG